MQNTDSTKPNYIAPTPNAVDAKRRPVLAKRSQDSNVSANDGKTHVIEGGTGTAAHPHGGAQPTQPNPSSLRQ